MYVRTDVLNFTLFYDLRNKDPMTIPMIPIITAVRFPSSEIKHTFPQKYLV